MAIKIVLLILSIIALITMGVVSGEYFFEFEEKDFFVSFLIINLTFSTVSFFWWALDQ